MSEQLQPQNHQPAEIAVPQIVYGDGVDPSIIVSPEAARQTMLDLGVSDENIVNSTIVVDPSNRLLNLGTHYTKEQARLRFPGLKAPGNVLRVSTKVRGKSRTAEQTNRVLVHEAEHLAQYDRHDKKVTAGHIATRGLALVGALVGSRLGKSKITKALATASGGFLGYQLGYLLAPHERQARLRQRTIKSNAIQR